MWKKALNKFLEEWKDRKEVLSAVLSGSRVTSFASKYSDIDVYIILSDDVEWRERGNKMIDGYLIEYFANPIKQIKSYFKEEFERNSFTTARILSIGKILFDKTGIGKKLKKEAQMLMKKKFKKINKTSMELMKYGLWDNLDNLKDLFDKNSENFDFLYNFHLRQILVTYSKFLRTEIPPYSRLVEFFTNEKFREEYKFAEFPDKKFSRLFVKCLKSEGRNEK